MIFYNVGKYCVYLILNMLKVAQWKVVCYVYSPANTLEIVLLVYFCFTPFSSSQQHKDFFIQFFSKLRLSRSLQSMEKILK